jgi:hypothetical protein
MDDISSLAASSTQAWETDEVVGQEPEASHMFQWWYTLTTPKVLTGNKNFVQREAERQARSLSSVAAFFLCVLVLFLPACFFMGTVIVLADSIAMVGTFIGLIVNRTGQTRAAGIVIVLGAELALGSAILLKGPLEPADIQLYDLYALIILLVASLMPTRAIFLFAAAHSAFIIIELFIHPDTPALAQNLQLQGQLLPAIVRSVGLQLLGSTVAFIWVRNATRAVERANRAEMVATLEHTIAEERAASEREKQELVESIQQLIQAQMTSTRGQSPSQLPYPPAKVLWPLVGAMNLLASRSQRTQQVEHDYQRLQQAIAAYARLVQQDGHASLPRFQTGTVLDQLILAAQLPGSQEKPQGFPHTENPASSDSLRRSFHGESSNEWFF